MTQFPAFPPIFPDIHTQKITEYFNSLSPDRPEKNKLFRFLPSEKEKASVQSSVATLPELQGAYFICFANRCGSNYVAQTISSDRRLVQAREYLNFDDVIEKSRELGFSSFKEYFYWRVNSSKGKEGIFGCKAGVGQLLFLYNEGLLSQFSPQPKFIHVVRRDVIAQAVSLYIANKTNQWTSEQPANDVPVIYDKNELVEFVEYICSRNAAFESIFHLFGINPLKVYYENFVERPGRGLKEIGKFIGVENLRYVRKAIKYTKQADQRNHELIAQLRQEFKL